MIQPVPWARVPQGGRRHACLCALALVALSLGSPAQAQPAKGPAATAGCPALLQHNVLRLQDEKPQALCQYAGRAVLVVNTASYCGFTNQYAGLEALYRRYQARGLVVLGFPSNDFGRQEPGSNQAIADFCENTFGVKFPMFSKTAVVGPNAHPMFRQLAERSGERPGWNFHKYLISRDGQAVHSFPSAMAPEHPAIVREIEKILSAK